MFTNFDCDCFYVADRAALIKTLSVLPEYLRNQATDSGAVIDYRDWQVPLGRRFRALKLWFIMRYYGREGLANILRAHVALAQELAAQVDADPRFERAAPTPFSVVCFRCRGTDEQNKRIEESVNATGEVFISGTVLNGRYTLRIAIGNGATERRHVQRAWELICEAAE
jgi:aromatic-L-amino-acid decarboxylase